MKDYLKFNHKFWNQSVDHHFNSDFYNVKDFLTHQNSLNSIELDTLGNVNNKSILHAMCHFGMDTLSLAKLGSKTTGIDFSEKAIQRAQELSVKTGIKANFVCTDFYNSTKTLQHRFDKVFMSYGTIGWLPDMNRWAETIKSLLVDKGELILVEFHPAVWMFDDNFEKIIYSYFNKEIIIEEANGSYADKESGVCQKIMSWNHPLEEVIMALLNVGFEIKMFREYDYSPYDCFNNTVKIDEKKYQIIGKEGKLPMVYALKAMKKISYENFVRWYCPYHRSIP